MRYNARTMPRKSASDSIRPYPGFELQHERVDVFLESVRKGAIPSLLFTGPEGCGKEFTALEFARALHCTEKTLCRLDRDPCAACLQSAHLEHADTHLIHPTPTQGAGEAEDGDVTDIAKVLDEKRQDIFATYRFTKKASIRIARARAIIQRANTKPFSSNFNVFIIVDAHAMREQAQNALLKVIEEPPPHSVVVVITHNPDSILFTIRSRCQRVRFTPLKTGVVESVLGEYYGADRDAARRAATLAQGNVRRARELLESYDDSDQKAAAQLVAGFHEAPDSWLIGQATVIGRGSNRDGVARFLHELSLLFRDIMSGDSALYVNGELEKEIDKEAKRWDRNRLPAIIDSISRARSEILHRNLNIDATLVDLFLNIKRSG